MDRYAVLVFRQGKPLTTEQQTAFTLNFGDLEAPYTQIQAATGDAVEQSGAVGYFEYLAFRRPARA